MILPDQREAIALATAGKWDRLHEMELAAINALVYPHWPDGTRYAPLGPKHDPKGHRHVLMALEIVRAWGPRCETWVWWSWVKPCGLCNRYLSRRFRCWKCGGTGHMNEEWTDDVITLVDGTIVRGCDGDD